MRFFAALLLVANMALGMRPGGRSGEHMAKPPPPPPPELSATIMKIVREVPIEIEQNLFNSSGVKDDCNDFPNEVMTVKDEKANGNFFNCKGVRFRTFVFFYQIQ